ncbi:MAG: hypothetical protein KF901_12585 [Myxococcales bacterium]|nr:hypothetical protein [Myxococcales bacterium]
MFHAEIHGKLVPDAPEHERAEDVLTSTVWGTLFLAGAWDLVTAWLRHARDEDGHGLDLGSGDGGPQWFRFWPRLQTIEPDLLLRIGSSLLLIEAKYLSGKSGAGHDEEGALRDQLARQWRSIHPPVEQAALYPGDVRAAIDGTTSRCVVYLVRARAMRKARKELETSRGLLGDDARLYLLTWENLHAELLARARREDLSNRWWEADLRALLERRGLQAFQGFQGLWSTKVARAVRAARVERRLGPQPWKPRFRDWMTEHGALRKLELASRLRAGASSCGRRRPGPDRADVPWEGEMVEGKLKRDEFKEAVGTAVRAVLDLYSEVDALLRELDTAMGQHGFVAWPVIPGSGKGRETNRILREWKGRLYVRGEDGIAGDEEEEGEEGDGGDESDDEQEDDRRRAGPRDVPQGSALAFVRVRIYHPRESGFEPELLCGVLSKARLACPGYPPNEPFRIKRGVTRRILSQIDRGMKEGNTELRTAAPVIVPKGVKLRNPGDRTLVFTVSEPFRSTPLYAIERVEQVQKIAEDLSATWTRQSSP